MKKNPVLPPKKKLLEKNFKMAGAPKNPRSPQFLLLNSLMGVCFLPQSKGFFLPPPHQKKRPRVFSLFGFLRGKKNFPPPKKAQTKAPPNIPKLNLGQVFFMEKKKNKVFFGPYFTAPLGKNPEKKKGVFYRPPPKMGKTKKDGFFFFFYFSQIKV